MAEQISQELLMRFLDGEASPEERQRVEASLTQSTELQRDLAVFQSLKDGLSGIQFDRSVRQLSVWDSVHRQLTRPIGWILLTLGTAVWMVYGAYLFASSEAAVIEKMATGAIVIGIIMLLTSIIWEQYHSWLTDPYKDLQR